MSHRFFLEQEIHEGTVTLEGDQAHHAIQVMRFTAGESVVLFDGNGQEHVAQIAEIGKKKLRLVIESTKKTSPAFPYEITIAVALPKGDRQKFLIEKLVELGVTRLIPLKTTRSVAVANGKVIERFAKAVIETSKQCRRNYLMKIMNQHTIAQLIEFAARLEDTNCYLAAPDSKTQLAPSLPQSHRSAIIAIGPEGGFDEAEAEQLSSADWKSVTLGPTILRIETAAVSAAVLLGSGLR